MRIEIIKIILSLAVELNSKVFRLKLKHCKFFYGFLFLNLMTQYPLHHYRQTLAARPTQSAKILLSQ